MGFNYHFTLSAPINATPEALGLFLKGVEKEAQKMGFKPTLVLDAIFDTPERHEFARRMVSAVQLRDERLTGVVLPRKEQVRDFDPNLGVCQIAPERAVILVVTDESGCESAFGFARYPDILQDINGRAIMKTGVGDRWYFRDFLNSPDERYRKIIQMFLDEGFVEEEEDEYAEDGGYVYIPVSETAAQEHLNAALITSPEQLAKPEFLKAYCSLAYLYPGFHPDEWEAWEGPADIKALAADAWRRANAGELKDNELYPYQATKAAIIHARRALD